MSPKWLLISQLALAILLTIIVYEVESDPAWNLLDIRTISNFTLQK